jgi:hypothetical protein
MTPRKPKRISFNCKRCKRKVSVTANSMIEAVRKHGKKHIKKKKVKKK